MGKWKEDDFGQEHPIEQGCLQRRELWVGERVTKIVDLEWTGRNIMHPDFDLPSKGCILNTANMVGLMAQENHAAYVATKGAMISLTKAMAIDCARYSIRVNAICPAGVWTPMLERWCEEQPAPSTIRKYLDDIHLLGYCPRGDVIADAVVFLISAKARFITGCVLPVSGGAALGYKRLP